MDEIDTLIRQLGSKDPDEQKAALNVLLEHDEDAVDPLISAFYAGVSEAHGILILQLVGEIGGPDALTLLRNVGYDDSQRPAWYAAARAALRHNTHSLSPSEQVNLAQDDAG